MGGPLGGSRQHLHVSGRRGLDGGEHLRLDGLDDLLRSGGLNQKGGLLLLLLEDHRGRGQSLQQMNIDTL